MRYRILGRTGLRVSEVGFGGAPAGLTNYIEPWNAEGSEEKRSLIDALRAALDLGINYLDTAPGYGAGASEAIFGEAIEGRRDECILATKIPIGSFEEVVRSADASLKRLRTDVLDLIQFHGGWYSESETERILEGGGLDACRKLQEEGKARFIGFTAEGPSPGVSRLIDSGAFDVLQARYNFMHQTSCDFVNDAGMIRDAKAAGMGIVSMRSLTSGTFQRIMRKSFPALREADLDRFLLNYNLSNPLLDVALVGMRRREEVERNAFLSDDDSERLDLVEIHRRYA